MHALGQGFSSTKSVVQTIGRKLKMSWHYRLTAFASAAAVGCFLAMGTIPASAEEIVLKMAVPDWPPTHIMKDLFDKNYKAPSGNDVKLEVDFIPWPDYYTRLNASLTSGEQK
jgi:multiple sugar transport system substrate-binding protein